MVSHPRRSWATQGCMCLYWRQGLVSSFVLAVSNDPTLSFHTSLFFRPSWDKYFVSNNTHVKMLNHDPASGRWWVLNVRPGAVRWHAFLSEAYVRLIGGLSLLNLFILRHSTWKQKNYGQPEGQTTGSFRIYNTKLSTCTLILDSSDSS